MWLRDRLAHYKCPGPSPSRRSCRAPIPASCTSRNSSPSTRRRPRRVSSISAHRRPVGSAADRPRPTAGRRGGSRGGGHPAGRILARRVHFRPHRGRTRGPPDRDGRLGARHPGPADRPLWPVAAGERGLRRRPALHRRPRRLGAARHRHRIAGLLDVAVRTGVRALAGRAGPGGVAGHRRPGAGRAIRRHIADPAQPSGAPQRIQHRRAGAAVGGTRRCAARRHRYRGRPRRKRPILLQRRRSRRVRHLGRPRHRPSGAHPAQPGTGARRADPPPRAPLPRRDPWAGAGQWAGDGRLLRLGALPPDAVLGLPSWCWA